MKNEKIMKVELIIFNFVILVFIIIFVVIFLFLFYVLFILIKESIDIIYFIEI